MDVVPGVGLVINLALYYCSQTLIFDQHIRHTPFTIYLASYSFWICDYALSREKSGQDLVMNLFPENFIGH